MLKNKKIIVGVSGGIAAYKAPDLVRRLRDAGARVRVVMTPGAQAFITPLTLQAVSGEPVHHDLLSETAEAGMGHIELARWADFIVIAPASANLMARLAHGYADDLLSALCLATTAPIAVAPAMNRVMWEQSITQENVRQLRKAGMKIFGPGEGTQACGETGWGRLLEPEALVTLIAKQLQPKQLVGKKVIITAGPTQEALDPVRYISNRSSGKMGYALAEAAFDAGAEVILVSGPTHLDVPGAIKRIDVVSAKQMHAAVMELVPGADVFIGVAAVADYRVQDIASQKIKKSSKILNVAMCRNPDILSCVAALTDGPFTVGFSAETENVVENANEKLKRKQCDMIIANQVGESQGFDQDEIEITLLEKDHVPIAFPLISKRAVADEIVSALVERLV